MYTPDSSIDDRFFYNPMNSLSESEADQTIQNKSSLISEQPAIVAKKTGTIIDPSFQQIEKKQATFQTTNPEIFKDVKLPDQSFNKVQQEQNKQKAQQQQQQSQYNKSQKPSEQSLKVPPSPQQETQGQSTRKRPRIFDPVNNDGLVDQQQFQKELNKMGGDEAHKKHIVVKEVQTAEELIIQKQLFLASNYNEKNVQQYIDKAKEKVEKYNSFFEDIQMFHYYNQQIIELGPRCLNKDGSLLDQASDDKRRKQAKEAFKQLYSSISRLETASRADFDQDCTEILESIKDDLDIRLKLQFAIDNLTKLKPQLSILKNNRNFQLEFQTYLELIKSSQRIESEKIRPQFEFIKSSLKSRAQKIYNLLE